MTAKQVPDDLTEVQAAIYGVALSLDALLVNGIPYGVLRQAAFPGFLEKAVGNLVRDLDALEEEAARVPLANQPRIAELLASLRARCRQLAELITELASFRTLSLEQVRSTVAQIPALRGECVLLIQELEVCLQTPKPFHPSRPAHSTASVDDFITDLEHLFTEEWSASR